MVRMKVARSEFTFSTPILANIAVSAAKTADRAAHTCQDERPFVVMTLPVLVELADYSHQQ
jgi:hypothetical protein